MRWSCPTKSLLALLIAAVTGALCSEGEGPITVEGLLAQAPAPSAPASGPQGWSLAAGLALGGSPAQGPCLGNATEESLPGGDQPESTASVGLGNPDPDFLPFGPSGPQSPLPKPFWVPTDSDPVPYFLGPPLQDIGRPGPDLVSAVAGFPDTLPGVPCEGCTRGNASCEPPDPHSETVSFPTFTVPPGLPRCEGASFSNPSAAAFVPADSVMQDPGADLFAAREMPLYSDFNNLLRTFRGTLKRKDAAFTKDEDLETALGGIVADIASVWVPSKRGAGAVNGSGFSTSDDPTNRALGMSTEGSNTTMFDVVTVTPGTIYTFAFAGASEGPATAGIAFYSSAWRLLSLPYFLVDSGDIEMYNMSIVAPPLTQKVVVFTSIAPNRDAGSHGASRMSVQSVNFGPATTGGLAIDYKGIVKTNNALAMGINTNYLMDDRNRRSQQYTFSQAMRDLGVGILRYPGGEKADGVYWAGRDTGTVPNPMPSRWQYGQNGRYDWPVADKLFFDYNNYRWSVPVMRFDEFLSIATEVGTETIGVINYDSANFQTGYSASWNSLKLAAMNWISYAVRQAKRVRLWEFSNESYFQSYNGFAKASQYAADFVNWVTALKQIDASSKFGAVGPSNRNGVGEVDCCGTRWWETVLPVVAATADFLICHSYPINAWSFSTYYQNTQNFQNDVQEIDAAVYNWAPVAHRERLRILVTETAAYDWNYKGYHWSNAKADLGHALVTVDLMASQLAYYKTDYVLFWNTRWRTSYNDESAAPGSVVDAMWDNNGFTAIGTAMKLVTFFKGATVLWSSSTQTVRCWGLIPPRTSNWALTLILLNKAPSSSSQTVNFYNYAGNTLGTAYQYGGTYDTDINPPYVKLTTRPTIVGGTLSILLAPVSVTVIVF